MKYRVLNKTAAVKITVWFVCISLYILINERFVKQLHLA
jgi:hypothetical protein